MIAKRHRLLHLAAALLGSTAVLTADSFAQELSRGDLREVPNEVGFPNQQIPVPTPPAAPGFVPPEYRPLRFLEDYSYLADPAKRTDFFDPIKYIPLGLGGPLYYLSFGGEWRERYEYNHNPSFGTTGYRENGYLLQRLALIADLHLGPHLRFFVEGISGQQFFSEAPSPPSQDDRLDLQMAFMELRSSASPQEYLLTRLGRQELSYGAGRLLATRAATNIPRSFDGITARAHQDNSTLSAFFFRPVLEDAAKFDGEDDRTTFWGVYGESVLPRLPAVNVNAYYLGIRREDTRYTIGTATEHAHIFGLRTFGTAAGWDYDVEGIGEAGSFGSKSMLAWALSQDSGYTFASLPWAPSLGLKAGVASGDRHPRDGTLETFDPLFFKSGYFNGSSLYAPSNLMDIHPTLQLTPYKTVVLGVGSDNLWRYSLNDGIYRVPGGVELQPVEHGSRYFGTTAEATAQWRVNRHLTIDLEYVYFFGGSYVRAAKGNDASFFSATASFLF